MHMARLVAAMALLASSATATHPILAELRNNEAPPSAGLLDAIVKLSDAQAAGSPTIGRALSSEEDLGVQEVNTEADIQVRGICHGNAHSEMAADGEEHFHSDHRTVYTIQVNGERCALHYFRDAELNNTRGDLTTMHGVPVHGYLLHSGAPTTTTVTTTTTHNVVTDTDDDDEDTSGVPATTCDFAMTSSPCSRERADSKPNEATIGGKTVVFESRQQRVNYCKRLAALTLEMTNPDGSVLQNAAATRALMKADDASANAELHRLATKENTWTHGTKTVLVYLVKMPGDSNAPMSFTAAENMMNKVGTFLQDSSYGKFDWEVTVVPQVIDVPNRRCEGGLEPARKAARAIAGGQYNTANYDLDVVIFNYMDKCGWLGLASVGGKDNWINWDPDEARNYVYGVVAHEFGHNLGLNHAANMGTSLRPYEEYGDSLDCMGDCGFGNSRGDGVGEHFNAYYKLILDWISDDNYVQVSDSIMPTTARLFAMDDKRGLGSSQDNKVVLAIDTPGKSWTYGSMHVNSDVGTGTRNINKGITFVKMDNWHYNTNSKRMDLEPDTYTQGDGAIKVGESVTFAISSSLEVTITNTKTGTTDGVAYADVALAYTRACGKVKNNKGCNNLPDCKWQQRGRKGQCVADDGSTPAPAPPTACGLLTNKMACERNSDRCRWIKVKVGRRRSFSCRAKL